MPYSIARAVERPFTRDRLGRRMHHPSLGLPPDDITAGLPAAAAKLRANKARLGRVALESTMQYAPWFETRYDETALRLFLRDYDQHIEQLARAMETGEDEYVISYAEWLVPIYRRRAVPMDDVSKLIEGLKRSIATVLSPEENDIAHEYLHLFIVRLSRHRRLPGDHKGNPIIRFF